MPTMFVRDPDTGKFIPVGGGGGSAIDDTTPSTVTVYSSKKTQDEIDRLDEQINEQKEAIGKKLNASELPTAINTALAQAKESGQFDGDPGDDYVLTEADKEEIAEMAAELVEVPEGGGGDSGWTLATDFTLEEDVYGFEWKQDAVVNEMFIFTNGRVSDAENTKTGGWATANLKIFKKDGSLTNYLYAYRNHFMVHSSNSYGSSIYVRQVGEKIYIHGIGTDTPDGGVGSQNNVAIPRCDSVRGFKLEAGSHMLKAGMRVEVYVR